MTRNPDNMSTGAEKPGTLLFRDGKLIVDEVVAQLFPPVHPERMEGITLFPPPQRQRELNFVPVKISCFFRRIDFELFSFFGIRKCKMNGLQDLICIFRDGNLPDF